MNYLDVGGVCHVRYVLFDDDPTAEVWASDYGFDRFELGVR